MSAPKPVGSIRCPGCQVGHTAPKSKDVLKKPIGSVQVIDEMYHLGRPENARACGQEAIEIMLQATEHHPDDLVVILAGYRDRMDTFRPSDPGMGSRIAQHLDWPDHGVDELCRIAELRAGATHCRFDAAGAAVGDFIGRRMTRPRFASARSIRNALDRARLRQANRLFAAPAVVPVDRTALETISAEDIRASRMFRQ